MSRYSLRMIIRSALSVLMAGAALTTSSCMLPRVTVSIGGEYNISDGTGAHTIEEKDVDLLENTSAGKTVHLAFIDGEYGIPYIMPEDAAKWVNYAMKDFRIGDFITECKADGSKVRLVQDNSHYILFDFENDLICYDNFPAFTATSSLGLDVPTVEFISDERIDYFKMLDASSTHPGSETTINAGDYGIDLIMQYGKYYIPLQLFSDFIMSPILSSCILYNGNAVTVIEDGDYTQTDEGFWDDCACNSSEALINYNYNELCMMLDTFYGLKEEHMITSFDKLMEDSGLKEDMLSGDATAASSALNRLISFYLDDIHSYYILPSLYSDFDKVDLSIGPCYKASDEVYERLMEGLHSTYPDGLDVYEESGDTAYITLADFYIDTDNAFDLTSTGAVKPYDTLDNIIISMNKIKRDDSPIKNVVLDLTLNTGGHIDAMAFTVSAFLGEVSLPARDVLTGAVSDLHFICDTNLDGEFDNADYLEDYNLFCLISPASFSCGNFAPYIFKNSGKVTLIGQTTGGGACMVRTFSTAMGSIFNISGTGQLSTIKNGSYYSVESGVTPDYYIPNYELFYDREYMTNFIHEKLGY